MAKATVLINTSLPPYNKSLPSKFEGVATIWLLSPIMLFFERPIIGKSFKYFSYCLVSLQPHIEEISVLFTSQHFLAKNYCRFLRIYTLSRGLDIHIKNS